MLKSNNLEFLSALFRKAPRLLLSLLNVSNYHLALDIIKRTTLEKGTAFPFLWKKKKIHTHTRNVQQLFLHFKIQNTLN